MATASLSKELAAMSAIEIGLSELEPTEVERVLRWACDRFGVQSAKAAVAATEKVAQGRVLEQAVPDESDTLAEFFGKLEPKNDAKKALVVAYWHQFKEGNATFEAAKINSELKHLGHKSSNITAALNSLKAVKPNLVVQMQKSGTSQQSRKTYKVTQAGKTAVEKMQSGEDD